MVLVDHPLWNSHAEARLQKLKLEFSLPFPERRAQTAKTLIQDANALFLLSLAFKTHANQFASISRLSPELLIQIFRIVAKNERASYSHTRFFSTGTLGWVRLTHVCRSWRYLFLDDHKTWADNAGVLPRATRAFLERSGSEIPISLYMKNGLLRPLSTAPLHRVQILHCHMWDQDEVDTLHDSFCENRFLELRDLETSVQDSGDNLGLLSIPSHITRGNAPTLTSWRSRGIFLDIIAPALTDLNLNVAVPATMLLRFLSNSPLLERFVGHPIWLSTDMNDQYVPPTTRVSLHHLREFKLVQCHWEKNPSAYDLYRQFMVHIDHPASADVTLETFERLRSMLDLELVISYMQKSPQTIRWRAELKPEYITFHAKSSPSPIEHGARIVGLQFESMQSLLRILRERSQNLSIQFGRIDQLSIKDEYHNQRWSQGQGVAELVELYGILSDAQSVRITCSGAFLTSTALALGHLTGTEYPFPALRRLRLASWHERKKFPSPKEIIAWLELRIKAGAGPSTLRLECYEGQDRNVVVDPELLALVPDTRYVESEDPDSEEDW